MHKASFTVAADHPALAGHFPGRPIVPGALLLAHALDVALAVPALAARIGPAPLLANVKFRATVGPASTLDLHFETTKTRLRFEILERERCVASGEFETVHTESAPRPTTTSSAPRGGLSSPAKPDLLRRVDP